MIASSEIKKKIPLSRRLINKVKYGLVLDSIRNQISRVGIKIIPYYWVQEGMNSISVPEIKGIVTDYTVEFIEAEEINKIDEEMSSYSKEGLLAYFSPGKKCLGLKYKGDLASFMFINLTDCDFTLSILPLKDDEAYLTFMYTLKTYRGKNLAPYLRYKSYEILKNMGREKIYSVSVLSNSSAIRYKEKLNAKNIRLILYIELFRKFKCSFNLRSY